MKRISFIMPTFNRSALICESIESVISEMDQDDEFIIIDDGSTDNTYEVVRPYTSKLRYFRQDNNGKSVALNRALEMTSGRYVWICDDDDLLTAGSVEKLISAIERSEADIVFGRYSRFCVTESGPSDMGTGYWPDLSKGSVQRHILEDAFIMHNAALVKRQSYERAGPFDIKMLRSQDYEMFTRLALTSTFSYVDDLVFLQRKHPGARGPASILHGAGKSDQVWKNFDRIIFERLRDFVPLSFYSSMYEGCDKAMVERAGLLQRACILARHGLWREALLDCIAAADLAQNQSLHVVEARICRRMTAGKHGFEGLLEKHIEPLVKRLGSQSGVGKSMLWQMLRGLFWRTKVGSYSTRLSALLYLVMPRNLFTFASQSLTKRLDFSESHLWERPPSLTLNAEALNKWRHLVGTSA